MKKIICTALSLVLILSGCVEEKKNTASNKDSYITCSFDELPPSLSLGDLDNKYYGGIYTYLFQGLVTMDRKGTIKPALAENWSVSNNGIGYIFNLRKDAKWSDGRTIYAEDFVAFFKNLLFNASKSNSAYNLFPISGAEDYTKGRAKFDGVAIRAINKNTLEIRLNKSCPDFLKILSSPEYVLRRDTELLKKWRNSYQSIKYSGAFKIEKIDREGVTLVKNPFYWNKEEITEKKFLLVEGKSEEEAFADFEGNKIDLLMNPPISEMGRIMKSENTIIINSEDVVALTLNPSDARLTKELNLRKSLAASIDTEDLKKKYLGELNPDEYDIFETTDVFRSFDKHVDEKYVKNNNTKNEPAKLSLILMVENNDLNKRISKGIAKQIEGELNVSVDVKYIMKEELEAKVKKGDFDMLLSSIDSDYDRKLSMYKALRSDSSSNILGYKNRELDNILKMAQFTGDEGQKDKYARECSDILEKNCILIPLFKEADILLKNDELEGIEVDSRNNIVINGIYIR